VLLVVVVVAGVSLDVGLRGEISNLALAIGLAAVIVGLAANRRLRPGSRWRTTIDP